MWAQKSVPSANVEALLKNNTETVSVTLNATALVSGETLFYKIFCLNGSDSTISNLSKIGYVELVDSNKNLVFKNKIFFKNGVGQGDFFVPATLQTGNYKIIAYTLLMLNKNSNQVFEKNITLINPFEKNILEAKSGDAIENTAVTSQESLISNLKTNQSNQITLSKDNFSVREKATLSISATSNLNNGNYALSVRKIDALTDVNKGLETKKSEALNNINGILLPELRGEILAGKIVAKNPENTVKNVSVALSIPEKSFAFKIIKTNELGEFIFNLEKKYSNPNVIIQIIDNNPENYSIVLNDINPLDLKKVNVASYINLSQDYKIAIEERSVANQIENAYYAKKTDVATKSLEQTNFFTPNSKDYLLDDYTRFPTLKETITEVLKEIYYTEKNKKYSLHVNDYNVNNKLSEPPLVMVDGLIIQDINELFEIKTEKISKVSIVSGGYFYGSNVFNGIINFVTFKNDYESKLSGDYIIKPNLIRPNSDKNYFSPNYSENDDQKRIPDYRYQLLWMPNLMTNQVTFFTSDVTGVFEISLQGYSNDGKLISEKKYFEVK